jgi:hypothetical protein
MQYYNIEKLTKRKSNTTKYYACNQTQKSQKQVPQAP